MKEMDLVQDYMKQDLDPAIILRESKPVTYTSSLPMKTWNGKNRRKQIYALQNKVSLERYYILFKGCMLLCTKHSVSFIIKTQIIHQCMKHYLGYEINYAFFLKLKDFISSVYIKTKGFIAQKTLTVKSWNGVAFGALSWKITVT